ncbi:tonB-system energizer ExbB [Paraburkholderia pallida]|uniref:Biopolymer transport protein ExbB n=1 Tax=Paraburkholderia pallida TaxID=2547399 RepID=A0A4P7D6U9_9BURK|nr:tonB-system energizer ExbB [Paraburkholderia pallida]QBR02770.1 tonB-system energizer ExbB [Paraburkholderia pallida]
MKRSDPVFAAVLAGVASTCAHAQTELAPVPHLNVIEMFRHADMLVQSVMLFLILCSVVTWAVMAEKSVVLGRAQRRSRQFIASIRGVRAVEDIAKRTADVAPSPVGKMWHVAKEEWDMFQANRRGAAITPHQADNLMSRMVVAATLAQEREMQELSRSMGILATIGSTAPFIGLFGTVWGILNSFIGIAASHATSLSVVAPGIAEALLATAIGLFAAIPAVMIYNKFARQISQITGTLDSFQGELSTIVSREMEVIG